MVQHSYAHESVSFIIEEQEGFADYIENMHQQPRNCFNMDWEAFSFLAKSLLNALLAQKPFEKYLTNFTHRKEGQVERSPKTTW